MAGEGHLGTCLKSPELVPMALGEAYICLTFYLNSCRRFPGFTWGLCCVSMKCSIN